MDASVEALTKREQEVLAHLVEGGRVATVARALFVSPHTVRNHLRSIFAKLGVHSQPELLERVREHPEVLGSAKPLSTPRTPESLIREYHEVDRKLTERIAKASNEPAGAPRLRAILHEALPLDAERAKEWRTRLDLWCLAPDSPELERVHREQMDRRRDLMQQRIRAAQDEGWVQADLDAAELAATLHSLILSATIQLLHVPSSRESQLRLIDAYVESLTKG